MPVLLSSRTQVRNAVVPAGMTIPSPASPLDDSAFLSRLRAGDRQAFETMAEAYYERLVRYAFGYVRDAAAAEDIVQDMLLNVWLAREQLTVRGSLASYLFGAVRNRALNYTRHERVMARWSERAAATDEHETWIAGTTTLPGSWELDDEAEAFEARMRAVRDAIAALPPRLREAFRLRVEHGLSFAEVADVMGLSLRSAQTTYLRAVQAVRERLGPYFA